MTIEINNVVTCKTLPGFEFIVSRFLKSRSTTKRFAALRQIDRSRGRLVLLPDTLVFPLNLLESVTEQKECPYRGKGFDNRRDYLLGLAEEYGVDVDTVFALANTLGPNEDFDGLVNAIQDAAEEL